MDIDEVRYIIRCSGGILGKGKNTFWGLVCANCNRKYESSHTASSLECVDFSTGSPVKNGTYFSPPDSYINPYAQIYALSKAGASYTPPGDRKVKFVSGHLTAPTDKKVYKGECPCGLIKCDYHEIIQ